MSLRVLNVAYPFAPAGPHAVGGAEQVLARLDQALVFHGHRSIVLGCEGSTGLGRVHTAFPLPDAIGAQWREQAYDRYRLEIERLIDEERVDLVHFHGVDFYHYLPRRSVPVLGTLHLPPEWYPSTLFSLARSDLWLHCVSEVQHAVCPLCRCLLPPIPNGVEVPEPSGRTKAKFAFSLGRICPEKGYHLAIRAARRAGIAFALAGEVFPYESHLNYFTREIQPLIGRGCRFVGPVSGSRKIRYLQKAKCLLVTSLVAETSSLVAMEALACGTPVIAFARGALPAIIEHGRTGFLVNDAEEMAAAIPLVSDISPEACRAAARERFSAEEMCRRYLERYQRLIELARNECRIPPRETVRL